MKGKKKLRLLLVDDEEAFLASSAPVLSRRGFEVDVAVDGLSALDKIDGMEYDVIVLDVKMPGMDGIEVLRNLRHTNPTIPVIMLTGHSSMYDAFKSAKIGVSEYLSKPIDMNLLAEEIRRVVADSIESAAEPRAARKDAATIGVMMVDDEVAFLETITRVLARRGMDVSAVTSGEDALAELAERSIDVVILDLKMPGMDGKETLKRIKKQFPHVQVIILTGHPSVRSAIELIKLGADEYIEKPPDTEELTSVIRRLFGRRQKGILERQQKLIDEIRERYPD